MPYARHVAQSEKRRLGREDWIAAALDTVAADGLAAVAVEPLAGRLGVTKGSFYSHFGTRDELVEAALDTWERRHSATLNDELREIADPAERLERALLAAVEFSQSGAPSPHVSLMGEMHDPRARAAMRRVSEARMAGLTRIYRDLGFSAKRAEHRARIAYAAYLGLLQMSRESPDRRLTKAEARAFTAELRETLL